VGVRRVVIRVGAKRRQKRGLVVGAAADPAVRAARPLGDRVATADELLGVFRRLEKFVREAAVAGIGRRREDVLALGIVQRVVEPRQHARGIAKRGVRRDVFYALAVNPDLASVAQAFEILLTGVWRCHPGVSMG